MIPEWNTLQKMKYIKPDKNEHIHAMHMCLCKLTYIGILDCQIAVHNRFSSLQNSYDSLTIISKQGTVMIAFYWLTFQIAQISGCKYYKNMFREWQLLEYLTFSLKQENSAGTHFLFFITKHIFKYFVSVLYLIDFFYSRNVDFHE